MNFTLNFYLELLLSKEDEISKSQKKQKKIKIVTTESKTIICKKYVVQ
jgi:hypothetical protein